VFNPSFQSLMIQARVEDLHRAAHTYDRGRDVNRLPAAQLSTRIQRSINRVFAGGSALNDEAESLYGCELAGDCSVATVGPRS
jgi:hypothetical protein